VTLEAFEVSHQKTNKDGHASARRFVAVRIRAFPSKYNKYVGLHPQGVFVLVRIRAVLVHVELILPVPGVVANFRNPTPQTIRSFNNATINVSAILERSKVRLAIV